MVGAHTPGSPGPSSEHLCLVNQVFIRRCSGLENKPSYHQMPRFHQAGLQDGSTFPLMLKWKPLEVPHAHSAAGLIHSRGLLLSHPRDWPTWEHASSLGHSSGELGLGRHLLTLDLSSLSRESLCWLILKRNPPHSGFMASCGDLAALGGGHGLLLAAGLTQA